MVKQLFILRHGEASYNAPTDFDRELTEHGRAALSLQVVKHRQLLETVDVIFHSPLVRTTQTATLVKDLLSLDAPLLASGALLSESSPQSVTELLSSVDQQSILLVSHQPLVSRLIEYLSGGERNSCPMSAGSLAHLRYDIPAAQLADLVAIFHP